MRNKYVIDASTLAELKQRFILLDTNFLIDASIFRQEVVELIDSFNKLGCSLVTTRAVITEFLGGTKNEDVLEEKIKFLELTFGRPIQQITSLAIDRDLPHSYDFLNFSRQCNKFEPTDFELYLTIKRYASAKLLLLTRNHLDFTDRLFSRVGFITLLGNKEIKTYGLYTVK